MSRREHDKVAGTYVALLRGINVGGKSPVDMRRLATTFERLGLTGVRTYINSGNILFTSSDDVHEAPIEAAIAEDFGLEVPVLLRSADDLRRLTDAVPAQWVNDGTMKCDVFFLWPDVDRPSVLEQVPHRPEIEDVRYFPGAFVRRIDRASINRSPLTRIVGSEIYRRLTVRNINTVRKLRAMATGG